MKKLEISITKAKLSSFSVSLDNKEPSISASIALFTEGGKPITSYQISTYAYDENSKFELPLEAYAPMKELAKVLEKVVVKHCRDAQKFIEAPKEEIDLVEV